MKKRASKNKKSVLRADLEVLNDPLVIAQLRAEHYRKNPMDWLREQVYTKDPRDPLKSEKHFPIEDFTAAIVQQFMDGKENIIHCVKSRQVMMTWLMAALFLYNAQCVPNRVNLFVSKKEDDAFDIVERAKFIYWHQDEDLRKIWALDRDINVMPKGSLVFLNGSKLQGLPQGPDQIRGQVVSNGLIDEAAFQDSLEETYTAFLPCAEKIILVSTANTGYFERLCDGKTTTKSFEMTRNSSGHRLMFLHYSAQKGKDPKTPEGAKWFADEVKKYPGGANSPKWRREMEMDWSAGVGDLVLPEFYEKRGEIITDTLVTPSSHPATAEFYGGLDWGNRNPSCFVVWMVTEEGSFECVWEYYIEGTATDAWRFSRYVRHHCPFIKMLKTVYYDPSMGWRNQQRQNGVLSIIEILQTQVPERDRIPALTRALVRNDMHFINVTHQLISEGNFKVSRSCPNVIREFGNLKYPQRKDTTNEPEKILDKNNHTWDATKYVILSHPRAKQIQVEQKHDTIGYSMKINEMARAMADEFGGNPADYYHDMFGRVKVYV